jgi:hypothetical protein
MKMHNTRVARIARIAKKVSGFFIYYGGNLESQYFFALMQSKEGIIYFHSCREGDGLI